jgi:NAD(P)-dependent dehydrogenase (short-subunit alcohol dehydrogenase family)/pimeloyl-ACP methyl ester carboxylesterase
VIDDVTSRPEPPRTRFVTGDGVELFVREWGEAAPDRPTVVLLHGYPDTGEVWRPVAEALAARYHVVVHDGRGAGASGAPRRTAAYRLEHLVGDIAAVIDATSPQRPVHLVGHDWGSIQGWEAAATDRLRGRVASFTSISGPCLDHVAARWRTPGLRVPSLRALPRSWYIVAFHLPVAAPLAWRTWLGGQWSGLLQRAEGVATDPAWPEPTIGRDGARGVRLYRANMLDRLRHPRERRVDVPVQVIVPAHDPFVAPSYSQHLERWVPQVWRRVVPGRHWIVRAEPERVARWIGELVDHVEGRSESPGLRRARGARPEVVLVTGAGSGIGRAACVAFAGRGAEVVAVDIDEAAAERTAELCRQAGGAGAVAQVVDVADGAAMEALAKWVGDTYGAADVVVNNAGIGMAGPVLATSVDDWDRILGVNLWGVIHGCRLLGAQMAERGEGGHLVNTASAAAFTPSRSFGAYATTKAAVLMLTECLRAELAGQGVGVSAVCPGFVDTGIAAATRYVGVDEAEQARRRQRAGRLYQRRGFPADKVAAAVVRAVDRDRAVVPVAAEAHLGRLGARLTPRLVRRLARVEIAPR